MSFTHKPNTGSLFPNDRKESHTHPDFKGDGVYEGKPVWLSMWVNESAGKPTWYKISIRPKEERPEEKPSQLVPPAADPDFDDKIPFALFIAPLAGVLAYAVHAVSWQL